MKISDSAIARVRWGLLGEWWCARADATEEECLAEMLRADLTAPVSDKELIRDRLFGGFECAEDKKRRHVYFATGHYTYLKPGANRPLSEEARREQWATLIKENGEPDNGPFTGA